MCCSAIHILCMHKKFEIIIRGCKKYDHALKLKRSTSQTSDSGNTVQHVYCISTYYLEFHSSLEDDLTQTSFFTHSSKKNFFVCTSNKNKMKFS